MLEEIEHNADIWHKGRGQKKVLFRTNCWVGVKSPKVFNEKKQCHAYMTYLTMINAYHLKFGNTFWSPKLRGCMGVGSAV